jgi:hypothetical protein
MSDLLFATPWWLLGSLVVVGAILFWTGNTRQLKGPQAAGVGLVILAILLKTLSFFIETDKEKVTRHTRELVAAVQSRDWTTFSSLLDDDVSLDTPAGTVFSKRDELVRGAKADTDTYTLTNVTAKVTDVQQDETGITVDLDAWSEQAATFGYRVPSSWKLSWDRAGSDWHLHQITCLKIGTENTNRLGQLIGK